MFFWETKPPRQGVLKRVIILQQHSFSATNPCHLWDLARALHKQDALGTYFSGYPKWRLSHAKSLPICTHSLPTLVTYALRRYFPESFRPADKDLFKWQDQLFDQAIAEKLATVNLGHYFHGMPGQCLKSFQAARARGVKTVLNHATGPVSQMVELLKPEYQRLQVDIASKMRIDESYFAGEKLEYQLADFHCVGSQVVAQQLEQEGVATDAIKVVPYAADREVFYYQETEQQTDLPSKKPYRLLFAGQQSIRKGLHYLCDALELLEDSEIELLLCGSKMQESAEDLKNYLGLSRVIQRGVLNQRELAKEMREADVLVLPSLEEGFGLVVPQALSCGTPCLVSHRVGAKDLISEGFNGYCFQAADAASLAEAIIQARATHCNGGWDRAALAEQVPGWEDCAEQFLNVFAG